MEDDNELTEYTGPWSVAIFLVDKAYGGPEEGGWYYNCGEPAPEHAQHIKGFSDIREARAYVETLERDVIPALNEGRRPISSVLSEGIYQAEVCEGLPKAYPAQRPYYE